MISPNAPLFTELYAVFKCTSCGCVCEYWDGALFKEKLRLSFRTCPDCGGKLKYTKETLCPSDSTDTVLRQYSLRNERILKTENRRYKNLPVLVSVILSDLSILDFIRV